MIHFGINSDHLLETWPKRFGRLGYVILHVADADAAVPSRTIAFKPDQARSLANELLRIADSIDPLIVDKPLT